MLAVVLFKHHMQLQLHIYTTATIYSGWTATPLHLPRAATHLNLCIRPG